MNRPSPSLASFSSAWAVIRGACAALFFTAVAFAQSASTGTGSIAGPVSNAGSGNNLQGAKVEIPALGLSTLTDNTGRFLLTNVPAGTYELVATYTGLDAGKATVTVTPGTEARTKFDLTASVYQMAEYKVSSILEGAAAAITAQRNASNVKNVVSMDSFGYLPNMSAGEVAIRLPGVAGNLDDEGNVTGLTIRGQGPTLNRVTVDGALISNVGGLNRQFQTHSLTGAMFDRLEVIKGHTPDMDADSLGATVNYVTKSPLSIAEKRRITYNATARWFPDFTEQDTLRDGHRVHPLVNLGYTEVFDVGGGERNLGITANVFYSENTAAYFRTIRDYENTLNSPAYLWDYRTQDAYNNRKQRSFNVRADYRLSSNTKLSFSTIYNDAFEPFNRLYEVRAFTNQTAPNDTTSGIVPGYTNTVTQVRPVTASEIDVTETMFSFRNRTRQMNLGAEHDFGPLDVNYQAIYSQTHSNLGVGNGGTLTTRLQNVGWTLDRTKSDLYPTFTQTAGPDMTDGNNYRPSSTLTARDSKRNVEVYDYTANATYTLPTTFKVALKAGGEYRVQRAYEVGGQRNWTYVGTGALPTDPTVKTWDNEKTGRRIPLFETAGFVNGGVLTTPSLWTENLYTNQVNRYTGTRGVSEKVSAGYVMIDTKWQKLGAIVGVRGERTQDDSWGYVRSKTLTTATQQAADPIGSAFADYGQNYTELHGSYNKAFPSAHLTYDVSKNLKAHASWSKSFGRPVMTNLVPGISFDDAAQTLTVSNPSLKPQEATNWDSTVEYYFEPAGTLSAGWFYKNIKDYIITGINQGTVGSGPNNGYNGQYSGYQLLSSGNAGEAIAQGFEFNYVQNFTFLPGLLSGLGASANYTLVNTHGNFGGATYLTNNQVVGFIPRTGNFGINYRYRAFSTRLSLNYTSAYIKAYTPGSPARNQYMDKRSVINVGFGYRINRWLNLSCDIANITNEPQRYYRGVPSRVERYIINGTAISFGVNGTF
jgi:TonB-dependent receptor